MFEKNFDSLKTMGFARYEKRDDVETADIIEAALNWRHDFLSTQEGIAMHCLLGNDKGHFADAIMATSQQSFMTMCENHPKAKSSQEFMALLKPDSIRLTANTILKENAAVPTDFSCIEFGTFNPKSPDQFDEKVMLEISDRIEQKYLSKFTEPRAHFMGKVDDATYSEIAFVENLGMARRICNGYVQDDTCLELLSIFDPESVDLDFWFKLA
ncbi:hypothetical protein WH96_05825 [Kiloniella spongiae]|uniref:EthD domain-containing protein n=1 Tax=Kiloniella spongiae TaxID=1489064 RepID=A0A0H2MGT5_9PROT|nr:hypothetical protein [Kiloniella spongiae]KLN61809.1 hypothetical protein WH96_05825 [Kiloniella spongiae]